MTIGGMRLSLPLILLLHCVQVSYWPADDQDVIEKKAIASKHFTPSKRTQAHQKEKVVQGCFKRFPRLASAFAFMPAIESILG